MDTSHIKTWFERVAHLDKPTDFAERCAAIEEVRELRRFIAALPSDAAQATHVKPEAKLVTFDEFLQYGRDHGANIVNGMPWSFTFNGHAVTHENDDLYSIGCPSIQFRRGEVLVATAFGDSRLIQVLQPPATQAVVLTDDQLSDLYHRAKAQCVGNWVEHVQSLLAQGTSL